MNNAHNTNAIHITRQGARLVLQFNGPGRTLYVITHAGPGAAIRLTIAALRAGADVAYHDVRDALGVA